MTHLLHPQRLRISAKSKRKQTRRASFREQLRRISFLEKDAKTRAYRHEEGITFLGIRDRNHSWEVMSSSEAKISRALGVNLRKWIEERLKQTGKRVSVLDMGCYDAWALGEIKQEFGENVRTVGSTIEKEPHHPYELVDRIVEGDVLGQKFHEKFDLIFSHRGAVFHSPTPQTVIKKTISLLKPNGIAVLDTSMDRPGRVWEIDAIQEMCKVEGASATLRGNHPRDTVFLIRKNPNKIKLPM